MQSWCEWLCIDPCRPPTTGGEGRVNIQVPEDYKHLHMPYLTSQAPTSTSNVSSTRAQASAAHTIPAITSGGSDAANVIHGLNDS